MGHSLPPRDSSIELGPGCGLLIDQRLEGEYASLTSRYREIRGAVLAAAFNCEYILDQLIKETLLPKTGEAVEQSLEDRRNSFDSLFLKGTVNFAKKVEILKKLHKEFAPLKESIQIDVFKELNKIRETRNKFAHYPLSFLVEGETPNQSLVAWLVTMNEKIRLDDSYLGELSKTLQFVHTSLEQALKTLTEEKKEVEETVV